MADPEEPDEDDHAPMRPTLGADALGVAHDAGNGSCESPPRERPLP
jgi:hypothetical protein